MDALNRLMERYATGDDVAFEPMYRLMAPRLYRFCRSLAVYKPEADDLFQETFLKLHRARATYISGSNPLHWSFAIARSLYLTRLRYWRRRPEVLGLNSDLTEHRELQVEQCSPEAEVLAEHLLELAAVELRRMPEKNRVAYILLKEEGLSTREAAAILGTTVTVVKQRAHRAYERLREVLDAADGTKHEGDTT